MILSCTEFLLESLLLESNIAYSNNFKKVLKRMKDPIAQKLLELEDKDYDVTYNFFDTKIDSDTFITFTPDRVAQTIMQSDKEVIKYVGGKGGWLKNNLETNGKIFQILGFVPKTEEVYNPKHEEIGEIISKHKSEKTGKTWCYVKFGGGEGVYNIDKLVSAKQDLKQLVFTKNRQDIRVGRAIRLLLSTAGISVPDAEIEKFVNDFRAQLSIINDVFSRFEIVEGQELLYWYKRENYLNPYMGVLGDSCQAVGRADWLEIYIDNPQTVQLVILKSEERDDKICGRALLWTLEDGRKLMDYIYTNRDSDVNVFKEFAKAKGWLQIDVDRGNYVAKIKPKWYDAYPSIDNMRYFDIETGRITNNWKSGYKELYWTQ